MIGSAQEKLQQRSDLEALVEQIEQETLEQKAEDVFSLWHAAKTLDKKFWRREAVNIVIGQSNVEQRRRFGDGVGIGGGVIWG